MLSIGESAHEGGELRTARVEGVGDVLEKEQAEDDVFVLGGVHVGPQQVGGVPQPLLEAERGVGDGGHAAAVGEAKKVGPPATSTGEEPVLK